MSTQLFLSSSFLYTHNMVLFINVKIHGFVNYYSTGEVIIINIIILSFKKCEPCDSKLKNKKLNEVHVFEKRSG